MNPIRSRKCNGKRQKLLSDQPAKYEASKLDRGFSVPRKGLLTFVPMIEGL